MRSRFATDIGLSREENQDSVRCEYFGHNLLAVVCDGMGGERAGKEASSMAVEEFFQRFSAGYSQSLTDEELRTLLISSVSAANSVIYTRARFDFKNFGMGTTLVAAFVTDHSALIVNVGDSRCYLITKQGLKQVTEDHNYAMDLFKQGKITREEVENHPQRHMLIRAVGVEKTVTADTFGYEFEDKISLLLCSDGLSGYCSDDAIYDVITHSTFDNVADELINLALKKGGRDNVTVAVISD